LSLAYTEPTDAGFASIATMTELKSLDLTGADVGDKGVAQLAGLTNLEELLLNHGRFNDKGLESLRSLTKLKRFEAVRTRFGPESAKVNRDDPRPGEAESRLHGDRR
jgi:hypothetical protein